MIEEIRSSGIDVIDHMQWGTHFCHFYETTADLLDTLVPYFKAGLDNNEYCIWVFSEPLTAAQAISALRTAVPAIDQHLTDRDIMIVSHRDWYLRCGSFNLQIVLGSWRQQVDEALARGYAGLRVTGDIVWEDQTECNNLAEYERAIDDSISELRITALCTYALGNCGATQVFDVMDTHQFALARRSGELEVVETSETKQSKAEIGRLNLELEGRVIERTRELEQRTIERQQAEKRSAAFATLARKLSGASVPLDAARIIADTADELFGWDSCSISLYDEVRDLVRPVLLSDTIDGQQRDVTSLFNDGEPTPRNRRLIEQSACLTIREEPYAFDEDSVPFGDTARPSAAIMDVLIRHASEIVGILSLQSYTPRSYDQDALNNLRALAEHCGEALNRMRAEQALRESEERYRDLIENSQDLFCTHDLDGHLLSVNRAAGKLLDCDLKELEGKGFREILAPEVRDQFDDYLARIRRYGVASGIVLVQTSKGERRIWEYYSTLRTEGVAAPIVRGMARDITERRRAEESLRLFRTLIDQSSDAIEVIDQNTFRFLDGNQSAYQSLGYTRKEFLTLSLFDIDPLIDREKVAQLDEQMKTSDFATVESLHRRKDGSTFPVEVNVKVVRLERDYRLAVVRDITERKRAEEAVRNAEQKYRELFENAKDATFVHDVAGCYTSVNAAAEALAGYPRDEILGKHFTEFIAPEYLGPAHESRCRKLKEAGETSYEAEVITRHGRRVPVKIDNRLIRRNGEVVGVQGTARDITERKRAEKERDVISEVMQSVNLTSNLDELLTQAHQSLKRVLYAENCCVVLYDKQTGLFEAQLFVDLLEANPFPIALSKTCTAKVFSSGKPLLMNEAILAELLDRGEVDLIGRPAPSFLAVPLMTAAETIGVIVVQHYEKENVYSQRDVGFLSAVASQLALAIERKRGEEALREREARLSAIYSAAPVGIGVDVNRVIQEVNYTLCRITGYSREELIGKNSRFLFITQEEYERVGREKFRVIAEHLPKSIMARLQRKDGRIIDVLMSAVPLDAADLPQGITFTVQDITERMQTEEALREAEQKYRELFENAKDAIYVHDLTGRYTSVNPAAEALSGYTRNEILGKHYTEFVAPEYVGPVRENLCHKLSKEGETCYEVDVLAKDGRRVPVEVNSRLIRRNGEVVGVQGIARDITERRRAQEAMRSYSRRLIEAQETERQNIARELHDEIGQILTAVRLNLQSAQRSSGTEAYQPRIEDSIVVIDEALQRVRELSLQLRPALLDDLGLTAALRWYADRYAQRTGFVVEVLSDCETGGRIDRELETACFRIAQEGLTNIARHTEATRVLVELKCVRGKLLLVIKDDGAGFDVDASFKNVSAGAALGLRGMEERALALGGQFAIKSTAGQGTEVRATFPLRRKRKSS